MKGIEMGEIGDYRPAKHPNCDAAHMRGVLN